MHADRTSSQPKQFEFERRPPLGAVHPGSTADLIRPDPPLIRNFAIRVAKQAVSVATLSTTSLWRPPSFFLIRPDPPPIRPGMRLCPDARAVRLGSDGRWHRLEECDDGNSRSGDGCSSECTVEAGYGADGNRLVLPRLLQART